MISNVSIEGDSELGTADPCAEPQACFTDATATCWVGSDQSRDAESAERRAVTLHTDLRNKANKWLRIGGDCTRWSGTRACYLHGNARNPKPLRHPTMLGDDPQMLAIASKDDKNRRGLRKRALEICAEQLQSVLHGFEALEAEQQLYWPPRDHVLRSIGHDHARHCFIPADAEPMSYASVAASIRTRAGRSESSLPLWQQQGTAARDSCDAGASALVASPDGDALHVHMHVGGAEREALSGFTRC